MVNLMTHVLDRYHPISLANRTHYQHCKLACTVPTHFTNDLVIPIKCLVLPVLTDIIIGNDWLRQHDSTIVCKNDKHDTMYRNRRWTLTGLHALADNLSVSLTISTLHRAHSIDKLKGWGWLKLSIPDNISITLLQVTAITTIKDAFLMLHIDDLLDDTYSAKIFSKINLLVQAYHQVQIQDADIAKTVFCIKPGSF
ncbi:hypothetical protein LPJ66_007204, partial [Kickxella alabastrina]